MPVCDNDELLRQIARGYAERYGQVLQEELSELERHPSESFSERGLERRVRKKLAAQKRKPYLRVFQALAACLAIALLLPRIWDSNVEAPPRIEPVPVPPLEEAAQDFAVIPLSAALPEGFTQSGFEQDREKSVYYIDDVYQDDVVLTLEKAPDTFSGDGLVALELGGVPAYGTQTGSYSLLTFTREEILYTLTCRHDINTLVRLGSGLTEV